MVTDTVEMAAMKITANIMEILSVNTIEKIEIILLKNNYKSSKELAKSWLKNWTDTMINVV